MGSILYIKTCPPKGGDTLFASMYAAYEALSDRMKAYLEGMTAVHDGEENYRGTYKYAGMDDKAGLSARGTPGGAHASGDRARRRCTSTAASPAASSACRATRATRS